MQRREIGIGQEYSERANETLVSHVSCPPALQVETAYSHVTVPLILLYKRAVGMLFSLSIFAPSSFTHLPPIQSSLLQCSHEKINCFTFCLIISVKCRIAKINVKSSEKQCVSSKWPTNSKALKNCWGKLKLAKWLQKPPFWLGLLTFTIAISLLDLAYGWLKGLCFYRHEQVFIQALLTHGAHGTFSGSSHKKGYFTFFNIKIKAILLREYTEHIAGTIKLSAYI